MYHIQNEQAFRDALLHQNLQHIYGELKFTDGTSVLLNDENIIGIPTVETKITTDSETFNISELYIGTLEIELKLDISEDRLKGSEITPYFQIDLDSGERSAPVPMGVFDIVSADKQPNGVKKVTAYDHIAKLAVPFPYDSSSGIIQFSSILSTIETITGVHFAQALPDLKLLFPDVVMDSIYPMSTQYAATCWLEVQYIAQYLGAYVIANRSGYIEFRRYSEEVKATITANQRFTARISDGGFSVKSICYADKFGRTYESTGGTIGSSSSKIFIPQDNVFIWDQEVTDDRSEEVVTAYYESILDPIRSEFNLVSWFPGEFDYYGDPTFDVGDMIALTGGVAGSSLRKFLICQNTWRFHGPQNLIAGGVPRVGDSVTSSGGGSGSVYSSTIINSTKNISTIPMSVYTDMLLGVPRTAARCSFKAKESTVILITATICILGTAESETITAVIYVDENTIGIQPEITGTDGNRDVLSFVFPVSVREGDHIVTIKAENYAEITNLSAEVSGQSISALGYDYDETDWEYTVTGDSAAVTGYSGGANVEIPEKLGGKEVTAIRSGAFSGDIETVYIPEGVEVIE